MKTCFVIMPIGNQQYGGKEITQADLRKKYDDLIAEAIRKADPTIQVTRADDVALPGSITTDILTRLMHSTLAIADITYPNPNVFYELGIRHAINTRTILIKEKDSPWNYFDISHLRYIDYENTASGLKDLAQNLKETMEWMDKNPNSPGNQFLELAALTRFRFPILYDVEEETRKKRQAMLAMLTPLITHPEMLTMMNDSTLSQDDKNKKMAALFSENPELMAKILENIISAGFYDQTFKS
jgi:hypothetical protein